MSVIGSHTDDFKYMYYEFQAVYIIYVAANK